VQLAHNLEDQLARWVLSELDIVHLVHDGGGEGEGGHGGGGGRGGEGGVKKQNGVCTAKKVGEGGRVGAYNITEQELLDVALATCSLLGLANASVSVCVCLCVCV